MSPVSIGSGKTADVSTPASAAEEGQPIIQSFVTSIVANRLIILVLERGPLLGSTMPELYREVYGVDLKTDMLREGYKKIRPLLEKDSRIRITRHGQDSLYTALSESSVLVKVPLERNVSLPLCERLTRLLRSKGTMYGATIPGAYLDEYGETLSVALQREGFHKLKEILQSDPRIIFEQHGGDFEYQLSADYVPPLTPLASHVQQTAETALPSTPTAFHNLVFPKGEWVPISREAMGL
jgi:hypothetical protein